MAAVTLQEARPAADVRRRRRLPFALALALALLFGIAALAVALRDHPPATAGPPASAPGFADLWSGRASLVLDKKWTSASLGAPDGSAYAAEHIEVVGNTWYLFNRRIIDQTCGRHGPGFRQMATQVRSSTDRGATWGPPTTIVAPTPGTPWACAATDGDAIYDAESGTWRYLFQCLGEETGWNGCYVERHDRSPIGPFTAPTSDPNPVITPGQLWRPICDDAGDECQRGPGRQPIVDEGTFDIFRFDGDAWWVSFHGYDGVHGYRGIARTTTFGRDDWQIDGEGGTPTDAVVDAADAAGWRESWQAGGPVGAGAASIVAQDGWYYQLVEIPDIKLECTPGQSWDLGLLRARTLSSTTWQQYPGGNPLVYSSHAQQADGRARQCNVPYPQLFADPTTGVSYVLHGRASADPAYDALYLYRLEWNRSLLANGDFALADPEGWQPLAGTSTQLSVERAPDGSPDGTPYLAFSCGAPSCDAGQSFYQDVPVDDTLGGEIVAFGGSFRADAGIVDLTVSLLQLDGAGAVVDSTSVPVSVGATYARVRGTAEIDQRARRLRFEIYPRTPATVRGDNLYLIPQDGCQGPRYPAC
jgi:hypothetical protein